MPSPFHDFDTAMQAGAEALFGESIRVLPMAGGEYAAGPDPDRPIKTAKATPSVGGEIAATDFNNSNRDGALAVRVPGEVWISRSSYAALGYTVQRGDLIELSDRGAPPPAVKVAAVLAGDYGDVRIVLG